MPWLTGYPRERIDWFPKVSTRKCVRCGMCMNCGRNVYDWTRSGPVVARPYDCVPGCNTCSILCMGAAIAFPTRKYIREVYRREKIWGQVKKALKKAGKI
ncbi:ferredoxin family protein [candidate division WOR-3 bacterium]|nr:ferredoxin family protein [candidate division WOR-3 bacterium]